MLIIFPIVIGLYLLCLVFLVLKKMPAMANFVFSEKKMPAAATPPGQQGASPKVALLQKIKIFMTKIWYPCQKRVRQMVAAGYQKLKLLRGIKIIKPKKMKSRANGQIKLSAAAIQEKTVKTRPAFFTKAFSQMKARFMVWRKDDFDNLKKFFNKKPEGRLILGETSEPKNQKAEQPMVSTKDHELLMQKRQDTDFNGFMTNGQEEPAYKFKRLSFDKVLASKGPEEKVLSPATESGKNKKLSRIAVKHVKGKKLKKGEKRLSRLQKEEQALISQISQRPQDVRPYEKLAEVYFKMKNYQDAQASWEYILKLKPNDKKAQRALAKIKKILHNKQPT